MSAQTENAATTTGPSLKQLLDDHDRDPDGTAEGLRRLAEEGAVEEGDLRRFAWLVNHVMGEKLRRWQDASDLLARTVDETADPACLCHLAVACTLAGRGAQAMALIPTIAARAECEAPVAQAAVQLGVLQWRDTADAPAGHAQAFNQVLAALDPWLDRLGGLAAPIAGHLNNVTSRLLDDEHADIEHPAYREALCGGAARAKAIWTQIGHWTNQERADYLVALCANRLEDHGRARQAALAGLQTILDHGQEDVDRAFLLLELARAERGLGRDEAAETARAQALQLAAGFDADLRAWFDSRA